MTRSERFERDLPDALRGLYLGPTPSYRDDLLGRTAATQQRPGWVFPGRWLPMSRSMRLAILLLALVAIASIAIAVAGALLREQRIAPNAFQLAGPVSHCDATLPDRVSLRMTSFSLDGPDAKPAELTAYEDGLVVDGPSAELGGTFDSLAATWTQRHLTPEGLRQLTTAVGGALPGCRSYAVDGRQRGVTVRVGDRLVVIGLGGGWSLETRMTSAAEAATAARLQERFADANLGLPGSAWADPAWQPYVPDRWRFTILFQPLGERNPGPSSAGLVLPDGSTLRTFGTDVEHDASTSAARCGVVGADEARSIGALFDKTSPRGGGPGSWSFLDAGERAVVSAVGLLPHEPDCVSLASEPSPTPEPAPSVPTVDPGLLADACDYLPASVVSDVIAPLDGDAEHNPTWTADWAMCWYPVAQDGLAIASSRRSVPADRVADQAESLLGAEGMRTTRIAGRDVFFSGCQSGGCRSAVVIWVPPHFIVMTWKGGGEGTLATLAARVISDLDGSPSSESPGP
jgi:hypothetical protein